jgi:formylmethanofuran--tetrahydromethanopterin N-formyltransferase
LSDEANCVYEIVIDGIDEASVAAAMVEGIQQAAGEGTVAISAGNYGGKLGKYHLHLRQLLDDNETANAAGATTGQ